MLNDLIMPSLYLKYIACETKLETAESDIISIIDMDFSVLVGNESDAYA